MGQLLATSILCGIGFTMSIFITSLAFSDEAQPYGTQARIAILLGSFVAALLGYFILRFTIQKPVKS